MPDTITPPHAPGRSEHPYSTFLMEVPTESMEVAFGVGKLRWDGPFSLRYPLSVPV